MIQPFNKPGGTFIKKPKLAKPVEKMSLSKSPTKTDPKNEEEEKRRIEARREKQRRRREKTVRNMEMDTEWHSHVHFVNFEHLKKKILNSIWKVLHIRKH